MVITLLVAGAVQYWETHHLMGNLPWLSHVSLDLQGSSRARNWLHLGVTLCSCVHLIIDWITQGDLLRALIFLSYSKNGGYDHFIIPLLVTYLWNTMWYWVSVWLLMLSKYLIQTPNTRGTSVGNRTVDHSDVVGASPIRDLVSYIRDLT